MDGLAKRLRKLDHVTTNVGNASAGDTGSNSAPRALTEWLTLLALTVVLFRAFAIEGYMITTGSMAPSLLGHHQLTICEDCGFTFAQGVGDDDQFGDATRAILAENVATLGDDEEIVWCPNCGHRQGRSSEIQRSEGDQLLVHKHAFLWRELVGRPPVRRWEVAVFRNPNDPTMAYVKRIVGLPGEQIQLLGGDVYADGQLQTKPYAAQLGTRIVVHDHDHEPTTNDSDLRPRWSVSGTAWEIDGGRFRLTDAAHAGRADSTMSWVSYGHWVRGGGTHTTAVPVLRWPADVDLPDRLLTPLEYDAANQELRCWGALPSAVREQLLARSSDEEFREALQKLYRDSHIAPITDECPYNRGPDRRPGNLVHDLMLELQVTCLRGRGAFAVVFQDGLHDREIVLDAGNRALVVREPGESETLTERSLNADVFDGPILLQASTFDGRLMVAVNGASVVSDLPLWDAPVDGPGLRRPFRFGAQGLDVLVEHVVLYRDIYYTTDPVLGPTNFQLGQEEFFALGDNSPVSVDSRFWEAGSLTKNLLIGKPLVVHLPSRPGTLEWRGRRHQIRVPDISRMRYIR